VDHAAKKGVEKIMFGGYTHLNVIELARYDLVRAVSLTSPHPPPMMMVDMMVTILHNRTSCTPWRTGRSAR
jgi:hypothetical protein